MREALVRSRVNQVNSVRFLLKSLGVVVASGSKAMTFTRRLRPLLDEATQALVEPLLTMIDALNAKIAVMDAELDAFGREQYPATLRLRQVPGVGREMGSGFVGVIVGRDPNKVTADECCLQGWATVLALGRTSLGRLAQGQPEDQRLATRTFQEVD